MTELPEVPVQENRVVVMLDPERLKPLPEDLYSEPCNKCAKPESRWAFMPIDANKDDVPLTTCSYCFLYESGWGLNRAVHLSGMSRDLEESLNTKFPRDEFGRMTDPKDCDRLLATIAYISRLHQLKVKSIMEELKAPDNEEESPIITLPEDRSRIIKPPQNQFRVK